MLNDTDKDWVEMACEKELTELQIRKKLKANRYTDKKVEEFVEYFNMVRPKEVLEERDEKEEAVFEDNVKKYIKDGGKDLSWGERREVKKFVKNIDKYSKILKDTINNIRKEIELINRNPEFMGRVDKELEDLKREIVDRIIDSKQVLEIEDPMTGEEATKESLNKCNIDMLISLLEENVEVLEALVNGKTE